MKQKNPFENSVSVVFNYSKTVPYLWIQRASKCITNPSWRIYVYFKYLHTLEIELNSVI